MFSMKRSTRESKQLNRPGCRWTAISLPFWTVHVHSRDWNCEGNFPIQLKVLLFSRSPICILFSRPHTLALFPSSASQVINFRLNRLPSCRIINLLVSLLAFDVFADHLPDRTAKTIGLTQGPPDFVPLADFERYNSHITPFLLNTLILCRPEGNLRCTAYSLDGSLFAWASPEQYSPPISQVTNFTESKLSTR